MPDEIIKLLEVPKLRSEVVGTIKKLYSYAVTTYDQNHSERDPSEEELEALEESKKKDSEKNDGEGRDDSGKECSD